LGGIPESICKYPSTLKSIYALILRMPRTNEDTNRIRYTISYADEPYMMCWVINLERKILKLETMEYKKYSSFTFLDPYKNIFGFTTAKVRKD